MGDKQILEGVGIPTAHHEGPYKGKVTFAVKPSERQGQGQGQVRKQRREVKYMVDISHHLQSNKAGSTWGLGFERLSIHCSSTCYILQCESSSRPLPPFPLPRTDSTTSPTPPYLTPSPSTSQRLAAPRGPRGRPAPPAPPAPPASPTAPTSACQRLANLQRPCQKTENYMAQKYTPHDSLYESTKIIYFRSVWSS